MKTVSPAPSAGVDTVQIFSGSPEDDSAPSSSWSTNGPNGSGRPSLLQELYDPAGGQSPHAQHSLASPDAFPSDESGWPQHNGGSPSIPPASVQNGGRPAEYTMIRRATLPYSRQEAPTSAMYAPPPPF